MPKKIVILGSSGSIGTQALDVIRHSPGLSVLALSVYQNTTLLEQQIVEFQPKAVAIADEAAAEAFIPTAERLGVQCFAGLDGLCQIAALPEAHTVLTAVVGISGLKPTLAAIEAGHTIALANKETLVAAGQLIMLKAKENHVAIYPVDSEHSAIFQCLEGQDKKNLNKIYLTASGGPFRGYNKEALQHVTLADALKHPNWVMGKKITIDSASMMNKGLEVIEAKWLFGCASKQIEVLIHPQSIIHSMVEFCDGAVIAQLGAPDMRIPIQYAFTYPERGNGVSAPLNFLALNQLTFEPPDLTAFPCLRFAYEALEAGGTMPCILNGANEMAVKLFLDRKISFSQIPFVIEKTLASASSVEDYSLDDLEYAHVWAENFVENHVL